MKEGVVLTFLFRQESKQRTDQRRGAEEFPFDTLMLSWVITSEINRPLLWTPLPASPCRFPYSCRLSVAFAYSIGAYTHAGGEYDTRLLCCLSDFVLI